uniref:NADH-ubiquinone oxidoreductase chain 3 n=1 Tax=Nucula nucleus TaxID=47129 RepID=D3G6E5_9BIVA|nr:NADH dehydrogenase subunit 3 [Nucula nucleus]
MITLFFGGLTSLLITGALLTLASILAKQTKMDREKQSPFECGFDPMSSARIPFSTRFFLLAVIFLIFDVEIVLLFPVISSLSIELTPLISSALLIFLTVLILGLFHEWNEGSLEWTK